MKVREATKEDFDEIWEIFHAVVQAGDTYAFSPYTSKEEALSGWCPDDGVTFVAVSDGTVVGTYTMTRNWCGLGDHVANSAFMVHPDCRGQGVGRAMGEHALDEARTAGFKGMQFNFVVSTNDAAIRLWESLGFRIVGTSPKAFCHAERGLVDAHVIYRDL